MKDFFVVVLETVGTVVMDCAVVGGAVEKSLVEAAVILSTVVRATVIGSAVVGIGVVSFVELCVVGVNEAVSVALSDGVEDMVVGSGVVSITKGRKCSLKSG